MREQFSNALFQAEYGSALRQARNRALRAKDDANAAADRRMARVLEARVDTIDRALADAGRITPHNALRANSTARFRAQVQNAPGVAWGWRDVSQAIRKALARTENWQEQGVMQ